MKARSRARDEERISKGQITPRALQQENSVARGFLRVIGFGPKLRPKNVAYLSVQPWTGQCAPDPVDHGVDLAQGD